MLEYDRDARTFEKRPLVAKVKSKMSQVEQFFMFSISPMPPEGTF